MAELLFKGISRVNEFKDPELLEQNEVQVLKNMVLDSESGKAIKRGGIVRQASRDNVGYPVLKIYDTTDVDGDNYLLINAYTDIYKSDNAVGSFTSLITGLTSYEKTKFLSYADKVIVYNDQDSAKVTDLTDNWSLGITKPDVSSVTLTLGAGGEL